MYIALHYFDIFLALLLLPVTVVAGIALNGLSRVRTAGGLRTGVGFAWCTIVLVLVASVLRLGTVLGQLAYGWEFAERVVPTGVPLALAPALIALLITGPRLHRLGRAARVGVAGPVEPALRWAATDPWLGTPMWAAAGAAVVGVYDVLFRPGASTLFAVAVALAGATLALAGVRANRRRLGRAPVGGAAGWVMAPVMAVLLFCGSCTAVPVVGELTSALPGRIGMTGHQADYGGGPAGGHDHAGTSVAALTGPDLAGAGPVRRFTLTAAETDRPVPRGQDDQGAGQQDRGSDRVWAFNGQVPGPELRVRQGDVVEVTLVNRLPDDGVTVHWHGVDVPNAMDGVAGVTQDAVAPGERFTYRFRAEDAGTYWYHSHQQSSEQVRRGLFGAFVVDPAEVPADTFDLTVVHHEAHGVTARARERSGTRFAVEPGRRVRARLVNAGNGTQSVTVRGTDVRVVAIDGTDLRGPTDLDGALVKIGGGGRYDVAFAMPDRPVAIGDIVLSPDGRADSAGGDAESFDPARYGTASASPFGRFDRNFKVVMDERFGAYDGQPNLLYTVNGKSFPDVPMLMVRSGDAVRTRFVNRSGIDHPMHLHGHHMLVLTRDDKPVTGSPWWVDTLTVSPGETYEVAFRADNPGMWMDHCHNLPHAAAGMVLHLGYQGVSSPFEVGRDTPNQPE